VSAAWILRTFFGWDVTAGEAPWNDPQRGWQNPSVHRHPDGRLYSGGDWYTDDILEKWIDPRTGRRREATKVPNKVNDPTAIGGQRFLTNEEWYSAVQRMILRDHPEGSGGFMRITGHIFNWRIQNGKVRFIEAQPQPYDWQDSYTKWDKDVPWVVGNQTGEPWWKKDVDPTKTDHWFMRVDDLEPSQKLFDKRWIHSLTTGERDAPFFEDMVLQSYSLYPESMELRKAFRTGWDQVRRGRRPRMPNGWGGTEKEAAYRAGVEYARRPD
jgi:hypothetical protein